MTIRGSCLCGGVHYEVDRVREFELCHCSRCRKASGSAFIAWLVAEPGDLRFVRGEELVRRYEAPVREAPPAYAIGFCSRCGSSLPSQMPAGGSWGIPAGTLDDDPGLKPEKHIYVELKAPWETIAGDLPQMTKQQIRAQRAAATKE
jgi:hypothetical protein